MKKLFLVANLSVTFALLTTTTFIQAQIAVSSAVTPTQMVNNLVGTGVTFSNVTFTGDPISRGTFSNGNTTNLGMTSGVALTTGRLSDIPVNNAANTTYNNTGTGIPELQAIANVTTFNGAILEFDFIPLSNTINVRYIFGSEEYSEFVNSTYNDAFAFFISGPGITGQQNIAVVPSTTTPVTINTINNGYSAGVPTGPCNNCSYFVNNVGITGATSIEYDGFTTELLATRTVIPCSTYHIKLMIADGGDAQWDSGVFIEENGLYSSGAMAAVTAVPAYGLGSAVEGCAGSQFVFTMPNALPTNSTFNFTVSGTATPGVDYVALPSSVTIPAGQTSYILPVNVLTDNITEGTETITLTVQISPCSTQSFTMNVTDATPINVNATNAAFCQGAGPVNISASSSGGDGTVSYSWSSGGAGTPISVNPSATTTYTVTATDQCGKTSTATSTVTVKPVPTSTFTATSPVCLGSPTSVTFSGSANTGSTYTWNFGGGTATPGGTTQGPHSVTYGAAGTYNVSLVVTDNGCVSTTTNRSVVVNPTPATPVVGSNSPVCSGGTLNLTANTIAGATYFWTGPGGFTSSLEDPVRTSATTAMSGTYTLYVAVSGCTSAVASTAVTVNSTPVAPSISSNSPVCQGNAINLSSVAVTGATYAWSGPNGFTSALQNPTISTATAANAGTYSAYLVVSGCTSATATTNVVVNPTPAAPVIASNTPLCPGSSLNLTATTISGATYAWSGPNGFTSNLQNPSIASVTTAATGIYSAYVTVSGCTSATANTNVVVNPTPATPTAGSNSPVCAGNTLNLTSTTVVGASYVWSGPNGFTSTLQNPSITGVTTAASGSYSLYAVALGCTSATANATVAITPLPASPVVSSNTPICQGNTINLTSNTITGATYSWSGPNGFASSLQNPTIASATTNMSGTYSAYVVVNSCTSATANTNVVVNPTPAAPVIASNTPICQGKALNLTANTITGATYVWSGPNSFASNLQNPSIAAAGTNAAGTYSAYVVVLGCTSATANTPVIVNPTPATPTVSTNSPVCVGNSLIFTTSTVAGASYAWSGPNGFTSTLQNPTINNVTAAAAGIYSLYTTVLGCTSATANTTVAITPLPASPVIGSNSPICENGALNLTANTITGATYVWSGPNAFTSSSQNPSVNPASLAASGTYSAYVVASGCTSSTANTTVVVNAIPAALSISSNTPVCEGAALNFTANTVTGGSYLWSGPNGFTSNVQNPSINPATTAALGSYLAYVVVSGCTSAVANHSATVNPIPAAPAIGSNTPVCENGTINLTANAINGATYVWSGPNSFASNAQNPSISPANINHAGSYSAYVVVLGCTSATATTPVAVNLIPATPNIGSNSPICENGTINLTANSTNGATYVWSGPNAFTSSLANPTLTPATLAMSGNYSAYIVVAGCSSAVASTPVVVNPTPALPTISSNGPVCLGATVNLTANTLAGGNYNWSGPNGYTSNVQNPSFVANNLNMAGNYSLYVEALGCTSATATTNVQINTMPVADFAVTPQVCLGSNAFALYGGTAPATATYTWTIGNGGTATGSGQGPINITWGTAGSHDVTLSVTQNGCTSLPVTHAVNVIAPVIPNAGPDQTACSGSVLNIGTPNATGATFTWTTPNGIADVNSAYTTGSWTNTGNNATTVTITLQSDNQGCTATDDAVITIVPYPVANFTAPAAQCFGNNSFNFSAGGTYMSNANFNWTFANANTPTSTLQNPTNISFTAPGTNNVTLTITQNGCASAPYTQPITVSQGPLAAFNEMPVQGCSPMLVNFTDQSVSTAGGMTYAWSFGTGATSTQASPSYTYTQPGIYSVTLSVQDNSGCSSSVTKNNIIRVYEQPQAGFYANPQEIFIDQPFTNINDGATGGVVSWNYTISNGAHFDVPSFTANFADTGYFTITQIVANQYGCTSTFTLDVHVRPVTEIFVPNAFTPDNHDDLNNTFKPSGINFKGYKMFIYNRWGELLFTTLDVNVGWNGRVRNSDVRAKQDQYVYKILYVDHRGNEQEIIGNILLLR